MADTQAQKTGDTLALSKDELHEITGYKSATKQLNMLHRRGFVRAYISRNGVVVERAHYDAVCRGQLNQSGPTACKPKTANLRFLSRA